MYTEFNKHLEIYLPLEIKEFQARREQIAEDLGGLAESVRHKGGIFSIATLFLRPQGHELPKAVEELVRLADLSKESEKHVYFSYRLNWSDKHIFRLEWPVQTDLSIASLEIAPNPRRPLGEHIGDRLGQIHRYITIDPKDKQGRSSDLVPQTQEEDTLELEEFMTRVDYLKFLITDPLLGSYQVNLMEGLISLAKQATLQLVYPSQSTISA